MNVFVHRFEGWRTEIEFLWNAGRCQVPVFLMERRLSVPAPAPVRSFFADPARSSQRMQLFKKIQSVMGNEFDELLFVSES